MTAQKFGKFTLTLILFITFFALAQKKPRIDLDSYSFDIKHQNLPNVVYPLEKRTYSLEIALFPSVYANYPDAEVAIPKKIQIEGWKKIDAKDNPTIRLRFELEEFSQQSAEIKSREVVEKDKNGRVVRSYFTYWSEISYYGRGNLILKTIDESTNTTENVALVPEKVNKFLSDVPATISPEVKKTIEKIKSYPLNIRLQNVSKDMLNYTEAEKYYKMNREELFNQYLKQFVETSVQNSNYNINNNYGFPVLLGSDNLWIIDAEDEEGINQKEALEAIKIIFSSMIPDEDIEITIKKLTPIVDYLESLKTKYPDNDKPSKKIRYSAYYNLGKIYLNTDRPLKAIKEGENLIENGYDKRDGERIIKDANKLIELFEKRKLKSRHNPILK